MELKEGIDFISKIEALSAMPAIALDVMGMLNDSATTVKDIVDKVMLDQAMVSFVLKGCNSPFFGIRTEITSISRAVQLLGFSNLKSILMSYFMKHLFSLSAKNEIKDHLWKHSLSVAVFSRNTSLYLKMDPEESYVAGLLHDIGKMVLYLDEPQKYEDIICRVESGGIDFISAEKQLFKLTHVDTGYFLAEKWKLSQLLKDVILYHHDLRLFMGADRIIGIVAFSDQLSHVFLERRYDDLDYFLKLFSITEQEVDKIVDKSKDVIENYLKSF